MPSRVKKTTRSRTLFHLVPNIQARDAETATAVVSASYELFGLATASTVVRVERLVASHRKRPTGWLVSVSVNTTYKRDRDRLDRLISQLERDNSKS